MEKKTMFTCEYDELEELIRKTFNLKELDEKIKYGSYYEFVADVECGNDSAQEYNLKKQPLDKSEQDDLDKWLAGSGQGYMTYVLMQEMCNRGVLEEGNYLISVCW